MKPRAGLRADKLGERLEAAVTATLEDWRAGDKTRRLWARDASLWTGNDEGRWLGWLDAPKADPVRLERLATIGAEARGGDFTYALLMGMGGSSLCADVLATTFGGIAACPRLLVLDSTDPAQVASVERQLDLRRTLFIVSSKSGTTLEPELFRRYFFQRLTEEVGASEAARRFIAITDPGSQLQRTAEADGFRRLFAGEPGIGGRYSALSDFGMVPAALMGLDAGRLLEKARVMAAACGPDAPPGENPGVVLGAILGTAAREGRDKVTIVASPGLASLGAWLEQLLAESTGKDGRGIIPVDREPTGPPDFYDDDRLFVAVTLAEDPDPGLDLALAAIEETGQPVVRIRLGDLYDLGGEFFRWEMATAVAGSILGVNPFDQHDVEASKIATRSLTAEYERMGALPPETPFFEEGGITLFTDGRNLAELLAISGEAPSLSRLLGAHAKRLRRHDYFALLAYLEMNEAHAGPLQHIRRSVRDARRVATCLGFGPRFLHSTGQAYKGGPGNGVFLQITCDDAADLPVPGRGYTFGVVKAAQARGDFQVLAGRGRRALRVHLGPNAAAGLRRVRVGIEQGL